MDETGDKGGKNSRLRGRNKMMWEGATMAEEMKSKRAQICSEGEIVIPEEGEPERERERER